MSEQSADITEQLLAINTTHLSGRDYVCKLIRYEDSTNNNLFYVRIISNDNIVLNNIPLDLFKNSPTIDIENHGLIINESVGYIDFADDTKLILVQICFNGHTKDTTDISNTFNTIVILQSDDMMTFKLSHIDTYRSNNIGKFASLDKSTSKIYVMYGNIINLIRLDDKIANDLETNKITNNVTVSPFNVCVDAISCVVENVELSSSYINVNNDLMCIKLKDSVNIFSIKNVENNKFLLIEVAKLVIDDTFSILSSFIISPFTRNKMFGISSSYDELTDTHLIACACARPIFDLSMINATVLDTSDIYLQTENNIIVINTTKIDDKKYNNKNITLLNDKININEFTNRTKLIVDTAIDTKNKKFCVAVGNLWSRGMISVKNFDSPQNVWNLTKIDIPLDIIKMVYKNDQKGHNLYVYISKFDGQMVHSLLEYKSDNKTNTMTENNTKSSCSINKHASGMWKKYFLVGFSIFFIIMLTVLMVLHSNESQWITDSLNFVNIALSSFVSIVASAQSSISEFVKVTLITSKQTWDNQFADNQFADNLQTLEIIKSNPDPEDTMTVEILEGSAYSFTEPDNPELNDLDSSNPMIANTMIRIFRNIHDMASSIKEKMVYEPSLPTNLN